MRTTGVIGPQEVVAKLEARLRGAHRYVCGATPWSSEIALGTSGFTGSRLRESWSGLHLDALEWRRWSEVSPPGVRVMWRTVTYDSSGDALQEIPARLVVDDLEAAALLVGGDHPAQVRRLRERWHRLVAQFPEARERGRVLTAVGRWPERDFEVLCRAAAFFAEPQPAVLTSRQVPVPGMDTKWLRNRLPWVARLAGVRSEELPVTTRRPGRVHFTYLDRDHLRNGGRKHDVDTEGDRKVVAYRPECVVICENRDVAQLFPDVRRGIAIEGEGTGPGLIASLPWIAAAERIWYWGDMDAQGFEILSGFRRAGLVVSSLLMDMTAYERWRHRGVHHDAAGRLLRWQQPRQVALGAAERELYLALCAKDWPHPRRIEQERLDLTEAWSAVVSGVGYRPV